MHPLLLADAQTLLFLDPDPTDLRHTRGLQIKRLGNGGLGELNLLTQGTEQNTSRRTITDGACGQPHQDQSHHQQRQKGSAPTTEQ